MQNVVAGALRQEFQGRTEAAVLEKFLRQQREERLRKERKDDANEETSEFLDTALMIISAAEADAFRVELDRYDAATVAALQENDEAMDHVRERMDKLLAKAYVLPDGRRIFKTEDGTRVFDEFGVEVGKDEIDPALIEDARPAWETYKIELDEKTRLLDERKELLDYQAKLDDARERLDAGDMTRKEFDQVRGELKADMPDAVRKQLPDLASDSKPDAEIASQAEDLDMSDDMVPAATIKPAVPGLS